ncbi:D-arabinono-1,4-lactone oxidase [Lewinella sp. IMCC34183]|uniref:D-arabinono-1,4-lactone oxidase n=1 Tax=Lewinella sp. IMCC34183 TaxID=2248762 RepID=UPI000E2228D4|nr:D-arabinono-1,4-lactone oxidase [Lewinella sp. IMCC34183]
MKRSHFLKLTTAAAAGGLVLPQFGCSTRKSTAIASETRAARTNWAGNYVYRADTLGTPATVADLQALLRDGGRKKALGSRHCFNDIADSPDVQISTRGLDQVIELDEVESLLTVGAGARYGDFSVMLHERGFAVHNLASLPHITVAGACATGTHGSGVTNGNLATSVLSLELVKPDGTLVRLDRDHPNFPAVAVGLGAFGIITSLTLELQPTFDVRQDIYLDLPNARLDADFDAIMSSGYSVSLFTDYRGDTISEVWVKRRTDEEADDLPAEWYGARAATEEMHPIAGLDPVNTTAQLGVPGPWYDRLPHFRMGFTPSAGKELQSEFFVARTDAVAALRALRGLSERIAPLLLVSEVRTIKADEFWMSPAYQRDSVALHFTWKQDEEAVRALLPAIESALAPFDVRPHWGKVFTVEADTLRQRYPKFDDFVALARRYDPAGAFRNDYLDRTVYGV